MTVVEYEKEFSCLSKYAPEPILTETFRCRQFEDGLNESIKMYLTAITSLQAVNFYQLVQAAMKFEKFEMMSEERKSERKFSKGSSFSSKRTTESQVELVHSATTKGRRKGLTMTSSSGRGTPTGEEERIECLYCHKHHFGTCRRITGGCFRCGSTNHLIVNCV